MPDNRWEAQFPQKLGTLSAPTPVERNPFVRWRTDRTRVIAQLGWIAIAFTDQMSMNPVTSFLVSALMVGGLPGGVSVSSVEMRDVAIPDALQDAASRQAQAEREKQARVILGRVRAIAPRFPIRRTPIV